MFIEPWHIANKAQQGRAEHKCRKGSARANAHPACPLCLAQELSYHVPSNTEKGVRAYLLKSISGFINPHQLTALVRMGPAQPVWRRSRCPQP